MLSFNRIDKIQSMNKKNARSKEKNVLSSFEKREKILKAAAEVFAQKGIEQATIDEIAAMAGVGKGTVYRQAGKKEDIVGFLFNEAICLTIDNIKMQTKKRTDPLLQFKEAVGALCDVYEKHLNLMTLANCQVAICINEHKHEGKTAIFRNKTNQLFGLIEKILKKAAEKKQIRPIDEVAITKGFFNFLDPLYYHFLQSKRNYTKNEIVQLTIDLFLNGLKIKK